MSKKYKARYPGLVPSQLVKFDVEIRQVKGGRKKVFYKEKRSSNNYKSLNYR